MRKMRYDLLVEYNADYDVSRTIGEVRALHEITGDPYFNEMADLFEQGSSRRYLEARTHTTLLG